MRVSYVQAVTLLVALLLSACASQPAANPGIQPETKTLVRPGAKVSIESVTNTSGQTPIPDLDKRLHDALLQSLAHEELQAGTPPSDHDLRLSIRITRYEQGNAFKRWLVPGYGSTVLGLQGELKDASTGTEIAKVDYLRTVATGGLYSVGAWSTIISETAAELAKNLKLQIEGAAKGSKADFVLTARPRAQEGVAVPPGPAAIVVRVDPIEDQRPEHVRIGERFALKAKMSDVYLTRNAPLYLREALADEIQLSGRRVGEADADVTAKLRLNKLWVYTNSTAFYWDVIADLDCDLMLEPVAPGAASVTRHLTVSKTERTYIWPSETLMSHVLNASLDELFMQIRTDPGWQTLTHGTSH